MQTNFTLPPILFLSLLAGCGGRPTGSAEAAEAMALLAQIQAHTGGGTLLDGADWLAQSKAPARTGRAADSVDPMTLVTEAEVATLLRQRGAAGDSTATAKFLVTKERIAARTCDGYGSSMCKIWWVAKDRDGATCSQGNLELAVLDQTAFALVAALYDKRLPDLGDEAVDALGVPYVRVGDLAATIVNTTCSEGLSRDVLAVAAKRLR
jgi:hypothetical protein